MLIEYLITKAKLNAKKLFLIDGLGAVISFFLLGIVLVRLETIFGIPPSVLYSLATIPVFFAIYDFYCYQKACQNSGLFLRIIAILNIMYCCLSLGLMFYHVKTVTALGWIYISIEIIVILLLSIIELRVAKKIIEEGM